MLVGVLALEPGEDTVACSSELGVDLREELTTASVIRVHRGDRGVQGELDSTAEHRLAVTIRHEVGRDDEGVAIESAVDSGDPHVCASTHRLSSRGGLTGHAE